MRSWLVLVFFLPSLAYGAIDRAFSAGLTYSHFDYNEDLPPTQQSHEIGWIPLFDLGMDMSFAPQWEWLASFQGTYRAETKFEGSTSVPGVMVEDKDTQTIFRGETSVRFYPIDGFRLLGGVAASRWERTLNYGTGYRETYTWYSLVLGAGAQILQQPSWDLWFDAAVLPMLSANLQVNFSDFTDYGDDANLTLGNRLGYRARFTWEMTVSPSAVLTISPFYERFEFGGTDTVANSTPFLGGSIREPDSRTEQYGIGGGVALTF